MSPALRLAPFALAACATATAAPLRCAESPAPQGPARHAGAVHPTLPTLRLENLRFQDLSECATGTCSIEGASPLAPTTPATDDGATTLPPAMAWVQVIRPGAAVAIARRANTDLLGVALVGTLSIERPGAPQVAPLRAAGWTAFLVPDGDAVLRAVGDAPAAAILVSAQGEAAITGRARDVELSDLVTHETLTWADGAMHARIAFEGPRSPRASLGVLIASDDAAVAEHAHDRAWEVLAAVSAAGHLHVPAQSVPGVARPLQARDRSVTAGSIVYVPAGVRHAWIPDGTHPLIAVQVYSPAGPEQRFRGLAGR